MMFGQDLIIFIKQIIPIENVRNYTRFLSKCLSVKIDDGFYIWTGSGGNGKSKLIELAQLVLGSWWTSRITYYKIKISSNSATPLSMERIQRIPCLVVAGPS